jgi:peptide/nickel transport system permease protein
VTIAVTIFGLLVVTFLIGRVVPVDPVLAVVGDRASQSTYDKVFVELGLDRPLYVQFGLYVEKAVTGDFGESVLTKKPIIDDIARAFPATLELATVASSSARCSASRSVSGPRSGRANWSTRWSASSV